MQSRQRLDNLAKFGHTHALEAFGLSCISARLQGDGQLTLVKSFEGARSDFCVHNGDGSIALGVQLKTVSKPQKGAINSCRYRFSNVRGYEGLLLVCMALDTSPPRVWMMPGSWVTAQSIDIPCVSQASRRKYAVFESSVEAMPNFFMHLLQEPSPQYQLATVDYFDVPTAPRTRLEQIAFLQLKHELPLNYEIPPVEQRPYDVIVDGARWQLKLCHYCRQKDRFRATLAKSAGRIDGRPTTQQYAPDDFEYLGLQLPADHPRLPARGMYLIPMRELVDRDLAGRGGAGGTSLNIYPHRRSHWSRSEWLDAYYLDLSCSQVALESYRRIVQRGPGLHE